jgi:hypothetical protein
LKTKKPFLKNFKIYFGVGNYSINQLKIVTGIANNIFITVLIYKKKAILTSAIKNILPLVLNKLRFYIWSHKKRLLFINSFKGNCHL